MASLIELSSLDEFKQIKNNNALNVINFWAAWAEPCKQMKDVVAELAKDPCLSGVTFVNVEAEKFPEVSQSNNVIAVPTCVLLKDGAEVDRINGVYPSELAQKVKQHSKTTSQSRASSEAGPSAKDELNQRLERLIKSHPLMLFMKGNPDNVKCGFSKKIVEILKSENLAFGSFDILSDESVRQGLKEYSNWPTYPQLYADGEFVGGVDIIRQLKESGELRSVLQAESDESASLSSQAPVPKQTTLEDRLRELINTQDVMVFMKGVPNEPRCGFSRHLVSILSDAKVQYGFFNILADEEIRQGLKTYSNWPTYPQIYVKGELIGGLDIIKQLQESGELEDTLKG